MWTFTQLLQDMIGDLTGAPQPIVVKLFSPDPELLATWALVWPTRWVTSP